MSTASSLLLLTLIVNGQLCSPAPIPASLAQFPFAAEEPGLEGFELAEVKDRLQEGSSGEERTLPEKDFINTAEVPGFTGEPAPAGPHDAVSQESDPPDFLRTAPQQYLIDDNGFNASLEDAEVEALHVDVEGESPDREEPVLIEDGAPVERSGDAGPTLVIVPDDPRGPSPESPEEEKSDVLVPVETQVEQVDQYESVMEETAPEEPASSNTSEAPQFEEQVFVYAVLEEPEEDSGAVAPEQAEDQTEPAAEETRASGSQDPAAVVSVDSSEEESRWGERVIIETISLDPPPGQDTQAEAHPTGPQQSAPEITVLEEPAPENLTLIVPLKDPVQEVSEDHAEEQILSDLLPQEDLEERNEPDERDPDRLMVSATEATSQSRTTGLDPAVDPPAATGLTGCSAQSVTSPAPASTDASVENVSASVKGAGSTDVGFTAESIPTGEEAGGEEHLTRDAADRPTEQRGRSAAGVSLHQVVTTRSSLTTVLLLVTLLVLLQSLVA